MYTDTHCHILSTEYDNYLDIIRNLKSNKIIRIINNGYNLETNKEVIKLSKEYNNVFGALGVHPDNIDEKIFETINFIKDNIKSKNIIAIGEIGLDYYHGSDNKEMQIKILREMLDIAQDN